MHYLKYVLGWVVTATLVACGGGGGSPGVTTGTSGAGSTPTGTPTLVVDMVDASGAKTNFVSGSGVTEGRTSGVWLGVGDPLRELPRAFSAAELPQGARDVQVYCPGCLVVGAPRHADEPGAAARFAAHPAFRDWPLVVLSDEPARAAKSDMNFLWTTFTRFDPARDIHAARQTVVGNHVALGPPIVIDARLKPGFPAELSCDPDTASLVSRRWNEYFPQGRVEMGDSEAAHLD